MKIGEIQWAAIDEHGNILGDGEQSAIGDEGHVRDMARYTKGFKSVGVKHYRIVRVQLVQVPKP